MASSKTDADYLEDAQFICKRLGNVFFTTDVRYDPVNRTSITIYKAIRRGTGLFGERRSAAQLVALLRRQLPKGGV